MRDVDFPPDQDAPDMRPDDPEEPMRYLRMFRGRYPAEAAALGEDELFAKVRDGLNLCSALRIREPRDVLRFLALRILMPSQQRNSPFLQRVIQRILDAVDDWSATKRLDFIYKHIVGRPAPASEPDFGPW